MEQTKDELLASNLTDKTNTSSVDFSYVVLKIEKLTSAMHLVTSFLNNSDPIKYKLRDQSLNLLQSSLNLKYGSYSYKTSIIDDLKKNIDGVVSFITVALTDGTVSQMNLTILQKEYRDLYNYLDQYQTSKESLIGKIEAPRSAPVAIPSSYNSSVEIKTPIANTFADQSSVYKPKYSPASNTDRRDKIMAFIATNGWSAINDITKTVPGVSSKTVQRELVNLVNEGLLLKKGDRRWARYSKVSTA